MQSLPVIQLLEDEEEKNLQLKNTECAVCLGEFEDGEWVKFLPDCSHAFHMTCIDICMVTLHSTCPICRTQVLEFHSCDEGLGSMDSLLEALRREDLVTERAAQYSNIRSEILRNHAIWAG